MKLTIAARLTREQPGRTLRPAPDLAGKQMRGPVNPWHDPCGRPPLPAKRDTDD